MSAVKVKLGKDGKPLMVGGKIVTNLNCCCGPVCPEGCAVSMCACVDLGGGISEYFSLNSAWLCSVSMTDSGLGYYQSTETSVTSHDFFSSDCTGSDVGGQSIVGTARLYPHSGDWALIVFWVSFGVGVGFYKGSAAHDGSTANLNEIAACDQRPWPAWLETALKSEFGRSTMYAVAYCGSVIVSIP